MKITVYTDGGCLNNNAPAADKVNGKVVCIGAYSAILLSNDQIISELSGICKGVTNNQAELIAAVKGLRAAFAISDDVLLVTDSNYVIQGIRMLPEYVANGWRTKKNKPLAHLSLWREMYKLLRGRNIAVQHINGHSGNIWNTRCDKLCSAALAQFR